MAIKVTQHRYSCTDSAANTILESLTKNSLRRPKFNNILLSMPAYISFNVYYDDKWDLGKDAAKKPVVIYLPDNGDKPLDINNALVLEAVFNGFFFIEIYETSAVLRNPNLLKPTEKEYLNSEGFSAPTPNQFDYSSDTEVVSKIQEIEYIFYILVAFVTNHSTDTKPFISYPISDNWLVVGEGAGAMKVGYVTSSSDSRDRAWGGYLKLAVMLNPHPPMVKQKTTFRPIRTDRWLLEMSASIEYGAGDKSRVPLVVVMNTNKTEYSNEYSDLIKINVSEKRAKSVMMFSNNKAIYGIDPITLLNWFSESMESKSLTYSKSDGGTEPMLTIDESRK